MTTHQLLDSTTHRDLRVHADADPALGDGVMSCLAVPSEFRRLQNVFPILFRRDLEHGTLSALALLGFEQGENLFVEDGRWDAPYRPLALSIQPFLIGRSADGEGPGQVHIDMGHPRIATGGEGMRLFDEAGVPTPYLETIADQLGELDEGYRASADFFAALERYELLEPFSLDVELADGASHRMVGYQLIDEDKLRALDAAALGDLHSAGHLMPIFMALASLSNFPALISRKNRRMGHG
ncbi:SapC family protein [Sphingomonas sp. KRR8]|uniref:SapC family protein n=1 Tax=Sphingomonas sp. KRR8 TaxID=2942996 RepID=UPI0020203804|nr:SapC family protein [Sphingomonas sp. KRR8]URD60899.1 SapC family protein [Sphingomonas sp. KRR8]